MMLFFYKILTECWRLLLDSGLFILMGLFMAGLIRTFLDPAAVSRHLGVGRFTSVIKAALLGIPIPL
jgi:hypothetical protein